MRNFLSFNVDYKLKKKNYGIDLVKYNIYKIEFDLGLLS